MKRKVTQKIKMMLAAILTASILTAQTGIHVQAEEPQPIPVSSEDELLILADQCREETFSTGKIFRLEADLDLSGYQDICIPVMNGTFDGNGHQITGLVLEEGTSDYGLFRYVGEDGSILNLTVEAEILGGEDQEHVGIIAGNNAGTIRNCVSRGTLNGQNQTGGIAGVNQETGKIQRCTNEALIDGRESTGGIAGCNEGTVTDCVNTGGINTSQEVKKEMDGDGRMEVSIPNAVTGLAKDERSDRTGGIAGVSSGTIAYCVNQGTVGYEHLGKAVGGIAGSQSGSLTYSRNEGVVSGGECVGGIAGYFEPYEAAAYDREYRGELEDELDALSDAADAFADAAEQTGDHLWDNVDALSDQLESLRASVSGYLDDYGNLAEEGRDELQDRIDALEDTIDGMQLGMDLEALTERTAQIRNDMQRMQEILELLKPYAEQTGGELQTVLEQYQAQMGELEEKLKALEGYLQSAGAGEEDPGETDDVPAEEGTADEQETSDAGPEESGEEPETPAAETEGPAADAEGSAAAQEEPAGKAGKSGEEPEAPAVETGESAADAEEPAAAQEEPAVETETSDVETAEPAAEPEESAEEEEGADTASAAGRMIRVAYVQTTEGSLLPGEAEAAQAAALIQELKELGEDIRVQLQGIVETLGTLPGRAESLRQDFITMDDQIQALISSVQDTLDDFGDELDGMREDLQSRGDGVSDRADLTGETLESDLDTLLDRMDDMKQCFENIRGILSDGLDDLSRRIEDRSVYVDMSELMDGTEENGKIVSCDNSGEIRADSQGGGIVGSISKDGAGDISGWMSDLLGEKDEDENDEEETITRHVQALVMDCVNTAAVLVEKDYAGGIAGKADYGVIASCESYEDVQAEDGSYVGGIAGRSELLIRDCYFLGGVGGKSYLGGAAGKGEDISGCYICAYLEPDEEGAYRGAVAGDAKGTVNDNYFVDNGSGAVDGVTRQSEAASVSYEEMLSINDMPGNFREFTVRFVDGDDVVWQGSFSYGDSLPEEDYPQLDAPEGEYVFWESKDLSSVRRNLSVHSIYRAYIPSLSAGTEDGNVQILLGGEFYPDSSLEVREVSEEKSASFEQMLEEQGLSGAYRLKGVYVYQIDQEENLRSEVSLRVKSSRRGNCLAVISGETALADGMPETEKTGSFLAADLYMEKSGYILELEKVPAWEGAAAAAVLCAAAAGLFRYVRKNRKKTEKKTS